MKKVGTIEINHNNVIEKLDILNKAIDLIEKKYIKHMNNILINKFTYISKLYNNINESYNLETVSILNRYYDNKIESKHKFNNINKEYNTLLICGDYNGKMNQCIKFIIEIKEFISNNYTKNIELICLINRFESLKIYVKLGSKHYNVCECGSVMKIFSNVSELICPNCGNIIILYGMAFEDTQFYNQEGNRSKHGSYDPSRHCKFWVNRIQAQENACIEKECIEKIIKCIKRDGIRDARRLLCSHIRLYLKEIHFTEYNDHVPLIRKMITGIIPPQLKNGELKKLYNLFDKAITAFNSIKPPNKSNTIYYPYIIYKILNSILPNNNRKKKILECIHLQSRDTLISNDILWEKVCKLINVLKYKPTDRNEQNILL